MKLFVTSFLLVCSIAFAQQPPKPPTAAPAKKTAHDKAALEAYLRHLELWVPQVNVKIGEPKASPTLPGFDEVVVTLSFSGGSKDELYYVSKDGQKIIKGFIFDINQSPFKSNLDKLKTDLQPSFGEPGAPVVLVVFSDYQCPYCKKEAQTLRNELTKAFPKDVRVYFKDFPLDHIHPWARAAAIAGRCVFRQNPLTFWDYHDWIFEQQQSITADNLSSKVFEFAKTKNLDSIQLGRCIETKATEGEVNRNVAEGRSLTVDGTPTVFLNGRKLPPNIEWPVMEQLIKIEIEHQKKVADAGEKCCTVTIPTIK